MSAPTPGPVSCSSCGAAVPGLPVTGMLEHDPVRGTSWVCPDCLRAHVRSIEAKLDRAWW